MTAGQDNASTLHEQVRQTYAAAGLASAGFTTIDVTATKPPS